MQATSPVTAPPAILTATALLQGKVPLAESLGVSIDYSRDSHPEWMEWVFTPANIIEEMSVPDARHLLASGVVQDFGEEATIREEALGLRGKEVAVRVYSAACENTMRELVKVAETAGLSCRLRARLCLACREELAALVAEFAALEVA